MSLRSAAPQVGVAFDAQAPRIAKGKACVLYGSLGAEERDGRLPLVHESPGCSSGHLVPPLSQRIGAGIDEHGRGDFVVHRVLGPGGHTVAESRAGVPRVAAGQPASGAS